MALPLKEKQKYVDDLRRNQQLDLKYAIQTHSENKTKYRNLQRFMHICRTEHEDEKKILGSEEAQARREADVLEEEALAQEVNKIKHDEMKELRLRQRLRENEPELRELEAKLKVAYVNKELSAQLAEREAARLAAKIKEKKDSELLVLAKYKEEELHRKQLEEEIIQKQIYRQELQDQMILREKSNRFLYEEFLREKKMLDDIVQRIYEEDCREQEEKMCKQQKTREEMIAFKVAQDIWKQRKRQELEEENIRIQKHLQDRAREIMERAEVKKKEAAAKAMVIENMAKKTFEREQELREREEVLQELLVEEQKEAIEERHRQEVEKELRSRLEIREALARQMAEREERLKQEALQDTLYKEQVMTQLAEQQRLDQLSEEAKRRRMLQLRRDVEQIMRDRRQRRAEELQLLTRLHEEEQKEEERRLRIVEEERIKLLKEHVKSLIGYLPKGVLKADDLPKLGSDVMEEYLQHYGNTIFNIS